MVRLVFAVFFALAILSVSGEAASSKQITLVPDKGHADDVLACALSRDGRMLVTGGDDRRAIIWDLKSGRNLYCLEHLPNSVYCVAFNKSSDKVYVGTSESLFDENGTETNSLSVWSVATGKRIQVLKESSNGFDDICFGSVSNKYAVANGREILIGVDGQSNFVSSYRSNGVFTRVIFSSDDKLLIAGRSDGDIELIDVRTHRLIRRTKCCKNATSLALCPDQNQVAIADGTSTIKLLSLRTFQISKSINAGHKISVLSVVRNSNALACAGDGSQIWLVDLFSGRLKDTLTAHRNSVNALCVSFDGTALASASSDPSIKLWDLASRKPKLTLKDESALLGAIALSHDRKMLACSTGSAIVVWNLTTGRQHYVLSGHHDAISALSFSSTRDYLVSSASDAVRVWDLSKRTLLRQFPGQRYVQNPARFLPDGVTVAAGSGPGTIVLWNVETGEKVKTLSEQKTCVQALAISPDGRFIAGCSSDVRRVWDLSAGKVWMELDGASPIQSFAFSPNGKLLCGGTLDHGLVFWDVANRKQLQKVKVSDDVINDVVFSPDGATIAVSSDDGMLRLVSTDTLKTLRVFAANSSDFGKAVFISSEKILSSGNDRAMELWSIPENENLCTIVPKATNDWLVTDGVGRFDANNLDNPKAAHWTQAENPPNIIPIEAFFKQYYTPGLLSHKLQDHALPVVQNIDGVDLHRPSLALEVSPNQVSKNVYRVTVKFQTDNVDSGVYSLRLFRNGQLVGYLPANESFASSETNLVDDTFPRSCSFLVNVPRDSSRSVDFSAYAFNKDKVKSQTVLVNKKLESVAPPVKPSAYVVAFGVNKYDDPNWKLECAVPDARTYINELRAELEGTKLFDHVASVGLTSTYEAPLDDELPATKEAVHDVIRALAGLAPTVQTNAEILKRRGIRKSAPDDLIFFAFACHGAGDTKSGEYYLFPSDIGPHQNGLTLRLRSRGISGAELTDWLRDVDARDLSLVIDSCHSGAVIASDYKPGPMDSQGLGQLAYYKRMRMITASQTSELASESRELGHGLLTYVILQRGLTGRQADVEPKDGTITFSKLFRFAADAVPRFYDDPVKEGDSKGRDIEPDNGQVIKYAQTPVLLDFTNQNIVKF
ncbi:MAG TPA: hypothetical protein V6C76_12785 [Drouetiella sp.]